MGYVKPECGGGGGLSGVHNPGADGLYAGPRYPRVFENGDGTRRIEWNDRGQVTSAAPVWHDSTRGGQGSLPVFRPGVVDYEGSWRFYPAPGRAYQGIDASGIYLNDVAASMLPAALRPDGFEPAPAPEPSCMFNGSPSFYFHPDDMDLPATQRRYAQGPTAGDPDSGHPGTPTFATGAGDTPGYRAGTPSQPYRPWEDPASEWYGCPTMTDVADPILPPVVDPWEPIPPTVDPDPVDDGEPPLNPDPSRPYDPTLPDGGPIDPDPSDDGGNGGPIDRGDRDPLDPTGDPSGPPPGLPGDGGGVAPPGGGGGFDPRSNLGMGLGVLLVLFLASRKR